jgi:hypothetical protein
MYMYNTGLSLAFAQALIVKNCKVESFTHRNTRKILAIVLRLFLCPSTFKTMATTE